ncbi:MAG: heme lyase CcmF/NrfE family subunit [Proteobacteria bacterium]|nr:heme lyase CcmF/NrfE family subunit [Pseudomonadota bacterium]
MIVELGHFALTLAFAVALFQAVVPLVGAGRGWVDWMRAAAPAARMQFLLTGFAFAALVNAFVSSDFSVRIVAENSNSQIPVLYRVSGTWGNHEGSMLLLVLILTLFGAMVAAFGRGLPLGLKARTLSVQSMIAAAFFGFILFTSNPFDRLVPAPLDGNDLNPLLQDIGLAIHPPFLYLGYVGLSMAFSFAVAALIEGKVDAAWARWVRPWTLLAWVMLTVGIALGSYWAYYELGWGGWWFWDPVENASFMPWLVAGALLHSAIVVEKRNALKAWTILLAILAFSLSLVGIFIVRSGVLTSVHAFANDPARGVFILAILGVTIVGSLTLFAWRAPGMRSEGLFQPVSREGGLILNNLLLAVAAAVVFTGTLAPLVREFIDGAKISVGAPFFELAFTPFMVIVIVAMPLGSLLPWKRGDLGRVMARLWWAAAVALALGGVVWGLQTGEALLAPVGLALAAWLILGVFVEIGARIGLPRASLGTALGRLVRLPRADWGKFLAHGGLGLSVMGIAAVTAWEIEDIRLASPGDVIPLGGYEIHFDSVSEGQGPNYVYQRGHFTVTRDGEVVAVMEPEKRLYPVQNQPTTEAAIDMGLTRDLYLVLGDKQTNGEDWVVRAYLKPLVNWIWLGALAMAIGGAISLTDRRYRVGAAVRRRRAAPVAAE